jgi:electron transfer flavoprotein beta subunit
MKILVPIKRVVDANVKVRVNADHSGVDLKDIKMAVNPFCEIAVEEAVRLKEKGLADEVVVVTIGPAKSEEQLRKTLALGADRGILVETEDQLDPLTVAKLLNTLVEREQPGLTLFGKQSIDADNNQTPQMLAALSGQSQGTYISEIEIDGEEIRVTREVDNGLETIALKLPAVVSADLRLNEPRYASLPNIMKAKRKPVEKLQASDLGIDLSSSIELLEVTPPPEREPGVIVGSVSELVDKLKNEAGVIA